LAKKRRAERDKEQEALADESAAIAADPAQEKAACTPAPVRDDKFNSAAIIPYGCGIDYIKAAMREFVDFLGFLNGQLNSKCLRRFESMVMPASFSGIVGEFMASTIPKYCPTLAKNTFHNGHPDMLPKGRYPKDALQHGTEGIEVKASRYGSGWQGHNPEECWLMVFVFESNRPVDITSGASPRPFRFKKVLLGQLTKADWSYSGRSETSRRTITASVTRSGFEKLKQNWIYQDVAAAPKR
jgi:hypothetical protein